MFDDRTIDIFSSRDKIRNQLIEYVKDYLELEGQDFSKTSYLSYLINVLSVLTSNLLYFSTSIYKESFLTRAIQKESVLNLSTFLGYRPRTATPATCSVLIGMPINFSSLNNTDERSVTITIPKDFKFLAGEIPFSLDAETIVNIVKKENTETGVFTTVATVLTYPDTGGSQTIKSEVQTDSKGFEILYFMVNVTQVEKVMYEFTIPELEPYEFYNTALYFDGDLASIDMVTTINEKTELTERWEFYDSLFLIPNDVRGYVYRKNENGIQIFFGNGVVGKHPPSNELCRILVGTTRGTDGNVISGAINSTERLYVRDYDPAGKLIDNNGNPYVMRPVKMNVINTEPATNGEDSQTIDEIKTSALASIKTLNRMVSRDDYDDLKTVVPELPVFHSKHLLKRSDIKTNEISLFTDIIYNDAIVPTRCAVWEFNEADNPTYTILITDTIEISGFNYYSLFNIVVQPNLKTCNYYYLVDEAEDAVILNRTYSINPVTKKNETRILPTYSKFITIIRDEDTGETLPDDEQKLRIELYYDELSEIESLGCYLITDWDGVQYTMDEYVIDEDTENEKTCFAIELDLITIPEGDKTYYFKMYELVEKESDPGEYTVEPLNEAQVKMIIKQNLDEFMYSAVQTSGTYPNRTITVYNVPVIKKNYFDKVNKDVFKKLIYDKILKLDISGLRMITDFLNLKFSDSTGPMTNMKYSKTTKESVIDINIKELPLTPEDEDRYIVTSDDTNPWLEDPWNKPSPFIAVYKELLGTWVFQQISTNDIIYVENEGKKMIFNSEKMVVPEKTIPIFLHIVIWRDKTYPATESGVVQNVKDNLINALYTNFGFDKPLYRATIIDIVKSTPGVANCVVLQPDHDIFFNFNIYTDLTQQELLEYVPQLIFVDSSNILVEVK